MKVYINDLSFASESDILSSWGKIKKFNELLNELTGTFMSEIIAPRNIWSIPICNYDVTTKKNKDGTRIKDDYYRYLREIFKKFIPKTNGEPIFSLEKDMRISSSSVGTAAASEGLIVSVALDSRFENETIIGWLKKKECELVEKTVKNLYDKDSTANFCYLADFTNCEKRNPLENPMWNKDISKKILNDVDFINISSEQRRALLIQYGTRIAEINGWEYNEKVSKLNTTNEHIRYIFCSESKFTSYPKAYLSIDLEGPEVCFELCDKKGHHKGEVSWNGERKEEKNNHGIKIK